VKKLLLLILVILSIVLGYSWANTISEQKSQIANQELKKTTILRFAIVSDSHNDNELLGKALEQAKGEGINFVVGLGDYTNIGTLDELRVAKAVFDGSMLSYFASSGDHDLWDSRNQGNEAINNFRQVFGESSHSLERDGIQIVILDNSDIYNGIDSESWEFLNRALAKCSGSDEQNREKLKCSKLTFVMAHKTPFHPESKHVMGENSTVVANQANGLIQLIEENNVDGFFSGDLHFFAQFKTPADTVKITTIGAVTEERNFQGPRFGLVTVYSDYTWEVEDVEIR